MVHTIDAVAYLRRFPDAQRVVLKLDVEGYEFGLLRDLLVSGALCMHVDDLFVEWHAGRINWHSLGLPVPEGSLQKAYSWMLQSVQGHKIYMPSELSSHCRTLLGSWA